MADWTAITGIVVSGVVGPSVGAGFALHRLRKEQAVTLVRDDRAELRSLLDAAEQELRRAGRWASGLSGTLVWHGRRIREHASDEYEHLRRCAQEVDRFAGRLALRLGVDSPVANTYVMAYDALGTVFKCVTNADVADLRETRDGMRVAVERFEAAHRDFLDKANALAHSKLE